MLFRTLFILSIQLLLFFNLHAQSMFKVEGTIQNAQVNSLQLATYKNHLAAFPEVITSPLINGNYVFTGDLAKPVFAELVYKGGKLKIYLEPGDEMNISFTDDQQQSQTSITGKGSENNLFYSSYVKQFADDLKDSLLRSKMMNSTIDVYENELFSLRKRQTEFFNNFPSKDKLSATMNATVINDINYRYWSLLLAYPVIRANSSAQITQVDPLPQVMMEQFGKVTINSEASLHLDSYRAFIYYYVIYFTSQKNGFKKFNDHSTAADRKVALAKEKLQGDVFNSWLAQFSLDEKDNVAPFVLKSMVNILNQSDEKQKYHPFVKSACTARMAMKDEGKPGLQVAGSQTAPNVSTASANDDIGMTDIDGKPFKLGDLKGKVVYIDFWASWCGPCRQMMPFSKQMHEKLTEKQKKQIVFLYISIDNDQNNWKKSINDLGMVGKQVISPGNWQSKVCSYFKINSIPRYMIMDKKGNIVDHNAKRPADPSVLDELIKLTAE